MTSAQNASRLPPRLRAGMAKVSFYAAAGMVCLALLIGWRERDEGYLTPETGLGYWLGVAGGLMMLALLYYSYRKRMKHGRGFGSIPTWFRIHMILGVTGPLLIVLHANFHLRALNSTVALVSMLVVACSGLVGRYLYRRVYAGLHGRKIIARDALAELATLRRDFGAQGQMAAAIFDRLDAFGRTIMERTGANAVESLVLGAVWQGRAIGMRARLRREIARLLEAAARAEDWGRSERRQRAKELERVVSAYLKATLEVAQLRFFERLFSLWHMFHLPLFFLLVLTALVHVWAVHRY
jgi:hypothetical protein